jgi:hypothetical protein
MKRLSFIAWPIVAIFLISSCGQSSSSDKGQDTDSTEQATTEGEGDIAEQTNPMRFGPGFNEALNQNKDYYHTITILPDSVTRLCIQAEKAKKDVFGVVIYGKRKGQPVRPRGVLYLLRNIRVANYNYIEIDRTGMSDTLTTYLTVWKLLDAGNNTWEQMKMNRAVVMPDPSECECSQIKMLRNKRRTRVSSSNGTSGQVDVVIIED